MHIDLGRAPQAGEAGSPLHLAEGLVRLADICNLWSVFANQAMETSNDRGAGRLSDALGRVASGDKAALRAVYDETSPTLFGICLRILGDRAEAEDALQDVYVSLWRHAGRFDPARAHPLSWLATFARNRAIDHLRSSGRARTAESLDVAVAVVDDQPGPFAAICAEQDRQKLISCLEILERNQRDAIRSAFFDGFTYAELAARADTPLGTMKSWVRRGLTQLKACLSQ